MVGSCRRTICVPRCIQHRRCPNALHAGPSGRRHSPSGSFAVCAVRFDRWLGRNGHPGTRPNRRYEGVLWPAHDHSWLRLAQSHQRRPE